MRLGGEKRQAQRSSRTRTKDEGEDEDYGGDEGVWFLGSELWDGL